MHSIPLEEDEAFPGAEAAAAAPAEVEMLGDMRGHRLAGRYLLVELLGSGELGCVYAGRDDAGGQAVTVKVLGLADRRDLVLRLADRARQRFGLRHPALAGLLAEGNVGGLWYEVFDDAPGKNCYHAHGDPRLEGGGFQTFARTLVEGLVVLHGAGAVHGAISPGNVVWGEAGPRIVDLDLSAPEAAGDLDPGPGDDVRALAGVLVELAPASALAERLAAIARGDARPSATEWAAELRAAPAGEARPSGWGLTATAPEVAPPAAAGWGLEAPAAAPGWALEPPAAAAEAPSVADAAPVAATQEAAPAASASDDAIPELSGSDLVSETGSHAHVPADSSLTPAAEAAAPELARETGEAGAAQAATGAGAEATTASAFGRASFEPVRATIVGDEHDEDWASPTSRSRGRRSIGWVVGVVAVVVLAILGWQMQRGEAPREEPPPEVAPAKRAELSSEASTLASVAAPPHAAVPSEPTPSEPPPSEPASPALPPVTGEVPATAATATPPVEPVAAERGDAAVADTAEDAVEEPAPDATVEQLSAADFRRILLRANRSQAARTCYRVHWQDPADVELIANVGPRGTIRKLRMDDGDLAACLRKIVLGLDFPRAARSAQHNFTFHRPSDGE